MLVIRLLFFTCLDCFLVSPRIIRPGNGLLTVIWTLVHKSLISNMHLRLNLWGYILNWGFPFHVTWICHNSSWHKLVSTFYPFLHFILIFLINITSKSIFIFIITTNFPWGIFSYSLFLVDYCRYLVFYFDIFLRVCCVTLFMGDENKCLFILDRKSGQRKDTTKMKTGKPVRFIRE